MSKKSEMVEVEVYVEQLPSEVSEQVAELPPAVNVAPAPAIVGLEKELIVAKVKGLLGEALELCKTLESQADERFGKAVVKLGETFGALR
jgi:hypothetical protein